MQLWCPDYQTPDIEIADYQEFTVHRCDIKFRGPGFDPFAGAQGSYFTCVGAAQTYGRFCETPFPALLADRIGLKALNLAVGGAGPGFYLQYPSLIDAANCGKFVILQAMAARHDTNSRFEANGHVEFLKDRIKGDIVDSGTAWRRIVDEDFENAPGYIAETRRSWLEETRRLIDALRVPAIFFWYSSREPDYEIDWDAMRELRARGEYVDLLNGLWGDVPQLVDGPTAQEAAALCQSQARCLSRRGMGAVLINRQTGKPIDPAHYKDRGLEYQPLAMGRNHYYPSAEMHEDAADALEPVVRRVIG
ncbi:MAG TPA: DUF6473 family protein [Acidocella sp.]|nr:DUF6473 family protein [Acidocella sp.]